MILLHSLSYDNTTNFVIDWLRFFGREFTRINLDRTRISPDDIDYINDEVTSYWYRKGHLRPLRGNVPFPGIKEHLKENDKNILEYCCYLLQQKKHINSYLNACPNKLIILEKAKKAGLLVPKSKLSKTVPGRTGAYIYKPVTEAGAIMMPGHVVLSVLTQEYKAEEATAESGLTLFQEKIEKKYELRIFYLNGQCWSMAIFSQRDKQTALDFRNYNEERPNRTVPYSLPKDIEDKLDRLMKELQLNCGSIDMIVSRDNLYYFLEVNPVGQFGMVSMPCNYYLEEKIATYLAYD